VFLKVLQGYKAALNIGSFGDNSSYSLSPFIQKEGFLIETGKLLWTWSYMLKTDCAPSLSESGN